MKITNSDGSDCSGSGTLTSGGPVRAIAEVDRNPSSRAGDIVEGPPRGGAPAEALKGADDCSDIGGDQTSDFWQDWPAAG